MTSTDPDDPTRVSFNINTTAAKKKINATIIASYGGATKSDIGDGQKRFSGGFETRLHIPAMTPAQLFTELLKNSDAR